MARKIGRMLGIGVVVGLGILLLGCGGGSTGPKTYEDGRVFVENRTEYELDVTFLNDAMETVETVVAPYATKVEVSQAVLKGGKQYTFTVTAHARNFSPHVDIELEINGPVTIQILEVSVHGSYGGPIQYSITGA